MGPGSDEALFVAKGLSFALHNTHGVEHIEDIMYLNGFPRTEHYESVQWIYTIIGDKEYDLFLAERKERVHIIKELGQ
jgi:hypothetical protein